MISLSKRIEEKHNTTQKFWAQTQLGGPCIFTKVNLGITKNPGDKTIRDKSPRNRDRELKIEKCRRCQAYSDAGFRLRQIH